jgi:hypothetical protein
MKFSVHTKSIVNFRLLVYGFFFLAANTLVSQSGIKPIDSGEFMKGQVLLMDSVTDPYSEKVRFIGLNRNDTVVFGVNEIESYVIDTVRFEKIYLPPEMGIKGQVFAAHKINGCISLYEYRLHGRTVFLPKKKINNVVNLASNKLRKSGYKFFKEHQGIAQKFKAGEYTSDSILLAVKKYNDWIVSEHRECKYNRATGHVKWWENVNADIIISGVYDNLMSGYYGDAFNHGGGYDVGLKVDLYRHLFSVKYTYGGLYFRKRNNIGTLSYLNVNSHALGARLNLLKNKNPFNTRYFFGNYHLFTSKYNVQPVACEGDVHNYAQAFGTAAEFGVGLRKGSMHIAVSYMRFKNTRNDLLYNELSFPEGYENNLPDEKEVFGSINVSVGFDISLVPLIREYIQF